MIIRTILEHGEETSRSTIAGEARNSSITRGRLDHDGFRWPFFGSWEKSGAMDIYLQKLRVESFHRRAFYLRRPCL
jgi:hypothetical protein